MKKSNIIYLLEECTFDEWYTVGFTYNESFAKQWADDGVIQSPRLYTAKEEIKE